MNYTRYSYQLILFPIILFVCVFILWALLMEIGEFVRGYGKIVPSGQAKRVQHLEGGIVSEILVNEGQAISKGQTIYKIRNEFALSNLTELKIDVNDKLAKKARLLSELSGAEEIQFPAEVVLNYPDIVDNEKKLFLQRKISTQNALNVLEQQADQKRLQLQEERAKSKNLSIQYKYSMEQQKILENLVQAGAGSKKELIDAKLRAQTLLTELEDTRNRILTTEKGVEEAKSRIEEAKTKNLLEYQTELSQVLIEIQKLKEQISANKDRVARTDIVSPVDGLIKTLAYNTVGGIIKPGETVAEIIPTNDILLVEARINPQDRARIWLGQKVNIAISAYDSRVHGKITGLVSEISADTFIDEGTRTPYYLVKIESNIKNFGDQKPLYPGMIAEVNIVAGNRTIMEYLLRPILRVLNHSFSEN